MQCRKFSDSKDFFGQGTIFSLKKLVLTSPKGKSWSFGQFYPEADVSQIEYAVVCTQDCDIEQEKATHLNVALLEPTNHLKKENPIRFLDLKFSDLVMPFESINLYSSDVLNSLKKPIDDLVDNNSSHFLFVDIEGEYYFINLAKMFPLKFAHLESLKGQAKYQLDGNFKQLLGWRLAYMYGRVGVEVYKPSTKNEIVKKILVSVGKVVKGQWPENSYELTAEQFSSIKSELGNYKSLKEKGRDESASKKRIYAKLIEFGVVKKQEEN